MLSSRSKFVIAVTDYKAPGEGTSFLSFLKGDLIILEEDSTGETVLNNGWCIGETLLPILDDLRLTQGVFSGRCERTTERGDFPSETVYVLPTLSKPPEDILALFSVEDAHHGRRLSSVHSNGTMETRERPHTLQEYSLDHFRPPPKRTMSKTLTLGAKRSSEELWR
jgi:myosin VIIa